MKALSSARACRTLRLNNTTQIKERVKEGRWETLGSDVPGAGLQPDQRRIICTADCVRKEVSTTEVELGTISASHPMPYFGYSSAMPQILKAGTDYYRPERDHHTAVIKMERLDGTQGPVRDDVHVRSAGWAVQWGPVRSWCKAVHGIILRTRENGDPISLSLWTW